MVEIIVAVAVTLVLTAAVVWPCAIGYRKKVVEAKIGNAEDRAREIIDEALKTAETKKREALLEAKEESMKTKNELDKETKERRAELQRYERRVLSKEEALDKKTEAIERREAGFAVREEQQKHLEFAGVSAGGDSSDPCGGAEGSEGSALHSCVGHAG